MRPVTISTACFALPDPEEDTSHITVAGNLRKALAMIEEATRRGSDLMVLPELFATKHTGRSAQETAEVLPDGGEISRALSGAARTHKMYLAGCLHERVPEGIYNTAALFDREGRLAGRYHKVHLPPGEEQTCLPGDGYPVFRTDFGVLGALICYDLNFPEAARCLALAGAEIILWPTMFSQPRAHFTDVFMRARAMENQVWLVSSNYAQRALNYAGGHIGRSAIIDWDGQVLADTGRREGVATATIDLDESKATAGTPECIFTMRRPETYGRIGAGD